MTIMSRFESNGGRKERGPSMIRVLRRVVAAALVLASALSASGNSQANTVTPPAYAQQTVIAAALKSTVPPELALAVARVGGKRWSHEEDSQAAIGIMGVRAALARVEFGIEPHQLRATRANAGVGVALLERLFGRHAERWDLALSHYRGGSLGRCGDEMIVHTHTIDYVADVMEWWRRYQDDEAVTALVLDVRQGHFPQDRFKIDHNTFLRAGQEPLRYDDGHIPSRGAHHDRSQGRRVVVTGESWRFR